MNRGHRSGWAALVSGLALFTVFVGVPGPEALAGRAAGGSPPVFLGESGAASSSAVAAAAPVLAAGFVDSPLLTGLTHPVALRFASDGRIFVAQKNGVVKVFHSLSDTSPATVVDLSTQVDDYWDRGLLGMALDPNFPTSPYIYLLYTYDAPPGQTAPVWNDACPTPPGPNTDGCPVTGKLVRITLSGDTITGSPLVLIQNEWCQQYPSHSIGDLRFGADGKLYVSGGEGASFTFIDYGQGGGTLSGTPTPANPCGDPPVPVGGAQTPPTAEGGSLRSQSPRRTSGEPVLLSGAVLRVDPATGAGLADNPMGSSSDANAKRIVAYGLRNPFRFTIRPGTNDVWIGDVGAGTWEEIDRQPSPTNSALNFGWPCYEGNSATSSGFQSAGLNLCSSLYSAGTATPPYYTYNHSASVVSGDGCPTANGSSISGMSFYQGGSYPASYNGALFFADYTRKCIWAMLAGSNGLPDPTKLQAIESGAAGPVNIEPGPGGDLFYPGFDDGAIHRISYTGASQPDLALLRPASSSSYETLATTADKANDGNSTTRWSSDPIDNQWWQVDLGSVQQVNTVSLNWETAYASSYKIQVSTDGTSFTDAATVNISSAGWKTTSFTAASARYVRVLGVTRATQYGISFWDAQVFGASGSVPVNTSLPVVSGFAGQGQTLTGTTGSWSNAPSSYAAQWQRCDATGANCQSIAGATALTYLVQAADVNQTLRLGVTASNGSGASQPAYSVVTAPVRADKALNQPATASSSQDSSLTPNLANDGNSATRWSSNFVDSQWWQVDLGSVQQVDTVALNWETAYASSYKIQVSTDGSSFTDAATVNIGSVGWKTTSFTAASARYVRVLGVTRATQYGISFWDAQVFGPSGPTPVIDTPSSTLTYAVGDLISFSGHATDPTQGTLPASALTWTLIIHHCPSPGNCHTHTVQTFTGVASGSFNAPDHGYPSYLELQLTATNSAGLSTTTSVSLNPKTVTLSFASNPSGLTLTVNGISSTTPFTTTVIVNSQNSISAATPQSLNGSSYQFASWSDGGAATHNITAPATNTTYTATYQAQSPSCSTGQYDAQYFSNQTLTGPPVLERCEQPPINYNWGTGSPGPGVPTDHFSARWTGSFNFNAGTYTFTATSDDGMRVYLDGTQIINAWIDQPVTTYTSTQTLAGGAHTVTVEYYENTGGAVAQLDWAPQAPQTVNLSFASSPTGLSLTVNGTASTAPFSRSVTVGSSVTLSAAPTQTLGGVTYQFVSWSDGGAASHTITAPASPTTYTATYTAATSAPVNTALPNVSGGTKRGRTLNTSNGSWTGITPMTFTYQWLRCDSGGSNCVPISGAAAQTYTLTAADVGFRIRSRVTATNSAGSASATSAATSLVRG